MKRIALLSTLLLWVCISLFAQQAQEDLRTDRQLVFPHFREAKVLQTFNRSIKVKANIMYRNAALCFIDESDGKIRQAFTNNIVGVEFDSIRYVKVDTVSMGLVVAEQGYNRLLAVTTIDMKRYKELTGGNTDLPFVSLDMGGMGMDQFIDLSGAEQQANKGYPLRRDYFFYLKGRIVPAKERLIKKEVDPKMKTAFKNLMADRWWSWKDEKSLSQLLMYFPK